MLVSKVFRDLSGTKRIPCRNWNKSLYNNIGRFIYRFLKLIEEAKPPPAVASANPVYSENPFSIDVFYKTVAKYFISKWRKPKGDLSDAIIFNTFGSKMHAQHFTSTATWRAETLRLRYNYQQERIRQSNPETAQIPLERNEGSNSRKRKATSQMKHENLFPWAQRLGKIKNSFFMPGSGGSLHGRDNTGRHARPFDMTPLKFVYGRMMLMYKKHKERLNPGQSPTSAGHFNEMADSFIPIADGLYFHNFFVTAKQYTNWLKNTHTKFRSALDPKIPKKELDYENNAILTRNIEDWEWESCQFHTVFDESPFSAQQIRELKQQEWGTDFDIEAEAVRRLCFTQKYFVLLHDKFQAHYDRLERESGANIVVL